jgi:tRNA pseudouridine55 synthase
MRMDGWTESGDLEKEVQPIDSELIKNIWATLTKDIFEKYLQEKFTGNLSQIPSKFSAIKVDGKAAYLSARKGKEVIIPERDFEIFDIRLIDYSFPKVTIEVMVSAGTYIRTLASDIAKSLWLDAYLTSLIRTGINKLTLDQSYDIDILEKNETIDYPALFPDYPIIDVSEEKNGNTLTVPSLTATRLLNWLTQNNALWLKNGIYFLRVSWVFRALIIAKDEILMIERNNISN